MTDHATRMTFRRMAPECELTGRTGSGYHVDRVAQRLGAGIAASGHHRLIQAGFFGFPLAGNAATAV